MALPSIHSDILTFTDLKVTGEFSGGLNATIHASGYLSLYGQPEVVTPRIVIDVFYKESKIGKAVLPADCFYDGKNEKDFSWMFAPSNPDDSNISELIGRYYEGHDSTITFKLSNAQPPHISNSFLVNFDACVLKGIKHLMVKEVTVTIGLGTILKDVNVKFDFENPLGCRLSFTSFDVTVYSQKRSVLATAHPSFSQPFTIMSEKTGTSPTFRAKLEMNQLSCLAEIGERDPKISVVVTGATIQLGSLQLRKLTMSFDDVPLVVKVLGINIAGWNPFS